MGFLDLFNDPSVIQSLLGINSAQAQGGFQPPPDSGRPPAAMPANAPPSAMPAAMPANPPPDSDQPVRPLAPSFPNPPPQPQSQGPASLVDRAGQPSPQIDFSGPATGRGLASGLGIGSGVQPPPGGLPLPGSPPIGQGGIGSDAARSPTAPWNGGQPLPGGAPLGQGGIGADVARSQPPIPPNPGGGLRTAMGGVTPPPPGQAPGPPMSLTPPAPLAPPVAAQQPGIMSSIGHALGLDDPRTKRTLLASLGSGLAQTGKGPGKLAAFAGGAGASLEGGTKQDNLEEVNAAKKKNDNFNQLSTTFKDMIAAQQANNGDAFKAAQARYLNARADATAAGKQFATDPATKKIFDVEKLVQQHANRLAQDRKTAKDAGISLGNNLDENRAIVAQDDAKVEAERQRLYKQFGINPQDAQKAITRGTAPNNPFAPKSLAEFHATVPVGGYYVNPSDGRLHIRTQAPPGADSGNQNPIQQQTDDSLAMTQ